MFLGRMTKHHRVQIRPVAMSAKFCCSEIDSAGRKKSPTPAMTRPHCINSVSELSLSQTRKLPQPPRRAQTHLHNRRPEVHRLRANGRVPQLRERALRHLSGGGGLCGGRGSRLHPLLHHAAEGRGEGSAEGRAGRAEGRGGRAQRAHAGCVGCGHAVWIWKRGEAVVGVGC